MRVAIYPGSFNPWHKGHEDILKKALKVFDKVVVVPMINPEKESESVELELEYENVSVHSCNGDINDAIYENNAIAIIRGLRDGKDLDYEKNQQYWGEEIGVYVPYVYFISDRSLLHVSSSALRLVSKLGYKHEY